MPQAPQEQNGFLEALGWLFGILFLMEALGSTSYPPLAAVFGVISFLLIPPCIRLVERLFHFRLGGKLKFLVLAGLLISTLPLMHEHNVETQATAEANPSPASPSLTDSLLALHKKDSIAAKEKARLAGVKPHGAGPAAGKVSARQTAAPVKLASAPAQQAPPPANLAVKESNPASANLAVKGNPPPSVKFTAKASIPLLPVNVLVKEKIPTPVPPVKESVLSPAVKENTRLSNKAYVLVKAGEYRRALPQLTKLITKNAKDTELLYSRAICYSRIGKIKAANKDCKMAVELGSKKAWVLYDKINPHIQRIAKPVTPPVVKSVAPPAAKSVAPSVVSHPVTSVHPMPPPHAPAPHHESKKPQMTVSRNKESTHVTTLHHKEPAHVKPPHHEEAPHHAPSAHDPASLHKTTPHKTPPVHHESAPLHKTPPAHHESAPRHVMPPHTTAPHHAPSPTKPKPANRSSAKPKPEHKAPPPHRKPPKKTPPKPKAPSHNFRWAKAKIQA